MVLTKKQRWLYNLLCQAQYAFWHLNLKFRMHRKTCNAVSSVGRFFPPNWNTVMFKSLKQVSFLGKMFNEVATMFMYFSSDTVQAWKKKDKFLVSRLTDYCSVTWEKKNYRLRLNIPKYPIFINLTGSWILNFIFLMKLLWNLIIDVIWCIST